MFGGFSPGQVVGFATDVTEGAVRSFGSHIKGVLGAGFAIDLAVTAGTAKRGELAQNEIGAVAGTAGGVVGAVVGAPLGSLAPGLGLIAGATIGSVLGPVGAVAGGVAGYSIGLPLSLLGGIAGSVIGDGIARSIARSTAGKVFTEGINMNRLHVGGNYRDTQQAYTMRARAAQEMSGSLLNARQWLGQESKLYHS